MWPLASRHLLVDTTYSYIMAIGEPSVTNWAQRIPNYQCLIKSSIDGDRRSIDMSGKACCPVPLVMLLLALLSCVFLAHGLYGLRPSSSARRIEATLLIIFSLAFSRPCSGRRQPQDAAAKGRCGRRRSRGRSTAAGRRRGGDDDGGEEGGPADGGLPGVRGQRPSRSQEPALRFVSDDPSSSTRLKWLKFI